MALSCAVSLWLRLFGRFGPHLWPFWALPCMSPQRISGLSHSGHHHKICQMSECAVQHAIRLRTSQEVVPNPSFSTIAKEPSRLLCGSVQDVYFLKPRDKAEQTHSFTHSFTHSVPRFRSVLAVLAVVPSSSS